MNIVIVESAAKAKTINKYLGKDFKVLASYGHVRDLPSKNGSVEPDEDFAMHWDVDSKSAKILKEITTAVKGADKLILATDPDREGEAISWHILQVLDKKKALKDLTVERVAFNAVTKNAILEALANPREIDQPLVSAYLARRALDYLVGFSISPVLWRKLPGSRSAGRVQSVALRLICDRELEIEQFVPIEYWSVIAQLKTGKGDEFEARIYSEDGKRLDKHAISTEDHAKALEAAIKNGRLNVGDIKAKSVKRNPYAPFTTSTLQMDASRKLGFSARQTMQVAQKLYEGVDLGGETVGLITYMRTDGVQIIPEAISACRSVIGRLYGDRYLPQSPRAYKTKAKNAQEAHEAVRPTDLNRLPEDIKSYLDKDGLALYRLIWQRTIASQMASAEMEQTSVDIDVKGDDGKPYKMRANGSVMRFDGYLKLYQEGLKKEDEEDRRLPALVEGESLNAEKVEAKQHFTEPPPRFSEATLVKRMEELGIGRPSTYASTLSVLQDRDYVRLEKRRFIPEDKGRLVTAFLESFFQRYVEYNFTASLEEQLDLISDGKLDWKEVLRDFWKDFTVAIDEIKDVRISAVLDALNEVLGPYIFPANEDGTDPRKCPSCEDGQIGLKVGRFGAFIGCTNYPECRFTRQFSQSNEEAGAGESGERELGEDPESGMPVYLKTGRFGPYIELGTPEDSDEKPKRASLPKGQDPQALDLDRALQLLSLPRDVGAHPESGKMIKAGLGRYGPFIEHNGLYANLPGVEDVFTVGLNHAVTLLAEKEKSGGRRGSTALKELGDHPELGGPVNVMSGRYGPYIKHGRINATIPKDKDPESITIEDAVALIEAKAATKGKGKAKEKTATKKTSTKKTTTKTATKKSATSKSKSKSA